MANFTEKAIKSAFLSLLEEKPLSKITVRDITDTCGINRNSFYYHFQDIPALLQEIFTSEITRIVGEKPSIDSVEDCVSTAVGFTLENRRAIMHIYNSINRDMFERYLWQVCTYSVGLYLDGAELKLGRRDRETLQRCFSGEIFGLIMGWFAGGMKEDARPFFSRVCEMKKDTVIKMIEYCEKNPMKDDA